MSAGSLGWVEAIQKIQVFSAAGGGVFFPAPYAEIAAPQDTKLSVRVPEPSDQRSIMIPTSETRPWPVNTIL